MKEPSSEELHLTECEQCGGTNIIYPSLNAFCSVCRHGMSLTDEEMAAVRANYPWLLSHSKANGPKKEKVPKEEYVKPSPGLTKRKLKPLPNQRALFQLDPEADFG